MAKHWQDLKLLTAAHSRDLRSFVIRFRIVRPIRDSISSDGPIRNLRIVRAVNRKETIGGG